MNKYLLIFLSFSFITFNYAQLGEVDLSFNPIDDRSHGDMSGYNSYVDDIAIQNDGKMIVVGNFTTYNGYDYNRIVRIHPDGSIDTTFNVGSGFDAFVSEVAIQSSGKIIVVGNFTQYNGMSSGCVVRLFPDGSIDNSFNVGTGTTGVIKSMDIDPNGNIFLGGSMSSFNLIPVTDIVKLDSEGNYDSSFDVVGDFGGGSSLIGIHFLSNNKLIAYGQFDDYDLSGLNCIVRLNSDGSLDTSFDTGIDPGWGVTSLYVDTNSDLYIAGSYQSVSGNSSIHHLARFGANGTHDPTFVVYPAVNNSSRVLTKINNKIFYEGDYGLEQRDLSGTVLFTNPFTLQLYSIAYDGTNLFLGCSANVGSEGVVKFLLANNTESPYYNIGNGSESLLQAEELPNGKILIGAGGKPINAYNSHLTTNAILRLLPDGSLDTTFAEIMISEEFAGMITGEFAIQQDGKIIMASKAEIGTSTYGVFRLNEDGTLDNSFTLDNAVDVTNKHINLCIQSDGKIILSISYDVSSTTYNRLYRLNPDGSLDASFSGWASNTMFTGGQVIRILCASNGNIYVGRKESDVLALLPNGDINNNFSNLNVNFLEVKDIIFDTDENLMIAGEFNGLYPDLIRVLRPSYTLDASFNCPSTGLDEVKLCLQNDNKIMLLHTQYSSIVNGYRNFVTRYNTDGTIDESILNSDWEALEINLAQDMTLDQYGNFLLTGGFNNMDSTFLKNGITRIQNDVNSDSCAYFDGLITVDSTVTCSSLGGISIEGLYGAAPYTYNWTSGGLGNSTSSQLNSGGTYICEITDTNNCTITVGTYVDGPSAIGNTFDVQTNIVATEFRPGFAANIWLDALNSGCQPVNGQLRLVLDSQLIYNSSQPAALVSGDTLIWTFNSQSFSSNSITPFINVTTSQLAQIGDTIHLLSSITPISGDSDPINNEIDYSRLIVNGYDPNDKRVSPAGKCAPNYVSSDQKLTYTIRFQNTGNSMAINVDIQDTLDSDLDISTLRIIGSSHQMYTDITENNLVKFVFDDIQLIDSLTNEPESHGYVIFEIDPKPNLPHGTLIDNKVDIYFDFNPPIRTNTVKNTIYVGDLSSLECFASLPSANANPYPTAFPNPFQDELKIELTKGISQITLYSSIGEVIIEKSTKDEGLAVLNTSKLKPGVYLLKLYSKDSEHIIRVVKSQ
jgi:uncharacterized delta-60 repeat protein/uncharacterized repeat protein (TIGR01451 family)